MAKNLFVGGLPYETTQDELQKLFAACGKVVSAKLIMDRETGRSKGFGFVEMGSEEEAQAAIAKLNGSSLGQRKIFVNEARPPEKRVPGAGPRPGGDRRPGSDRPPGGGFGGGEKTWGDKPEDGGEKRGGFGGKKWGTKPAGGGGKKWSDKPGFGRKDKRDGFGGGKRGGFGEKRGRHGGEDDDAGD